MNKYFIYFSAFIFTSCFSYKELEFKGINNISFSKQSGCNPICVYIDIFNPNNYNIKIKNGNASLAVNDKNIGNLQLNQKVKLKSNEVAVLQLNISSTSTKVFKTIFSSIEVLFGKKVNLIIIGNIKAKVYGFSKKISFNESRKIGIGDLKK